MQTTMPTMPTTWTGDAVHRLRTALQLTQGEMAGRVGVTTATISHWETGKRTPSGSAAILLDFLQNEADRLAAGKK
jgi:DNA-binding transcriptional regulator YiaG